MLRLNVETSFRAAGYAAILLIGVLSLVSGALRPDTVPYAAALETAQLFVSGRHSRFSDFAVSALGAVLGITVAFGIAHVEIGRPLYQMTKRRWAARFPSRSPVRNNARTSLLQSIGAMAVAK